ncbi:MAG TPA: hypothetical protein PKA90_16050 [Ignavibacteria bacterium]|nr:hypothetical protein [Ignavibacteria bacterium]HMR41930.1 hypothetical protein [Ignavibacteria bacterium]
MITKINFILSLPYVVVFKTDSPEAVDIKGKYGNASGYLNPEAPNIPNNPQTKSEPIVSEDLTSRNRFAFN